MILLVASHYRQLENGLGCNNPFPFVFFFKNGEIKMNVNGKLIILLGFSYAAGYCYGKVRGLVIGATLKEED